VSASEDFAGVQWRGAAAAWLAEQRRACRGRFRPTPIQAKAMRPILDGKSLALMAPTGTGKTLAYLLPLWARLVQGVSSLQGPRLLIVTPSQDLQAQVGGVAMALAGENCEDSVLVLRRNLDGLDEELSAAAVVVATPSQLMELAELPGMEALWRRMMVGLAALVLDEADSLVSRVNPANSTIVRLLNRMATAWRQRGDRPQDRKEQLLQLVVASASVDAVTLGLLEEATGARFSLVRAGTEGVVSVEGRSQAGEAVRATKGLDAPLPGASPLEDGVLPSGLRHTILVMEDLIQRNGAVSKGAVPAIVQVIWSLSPSRCLVVLAEGRREAERGGSLGKYLYSLRRELAAIGFQLCTASAAVEAAMPAAAGAAASAGAPPRQVLIGRSEAIRGLDFQGLDAVVLVGALESAKEYLHATGRTARWDPVAGAPTQGTVVSIVGRLTARKLRGWGKSMGFRLQNFLLKPKPEALRRELPPARVPGRQRAAPPTPRRAPQASEELAFDALDL